MIEQDTSQTKEKKTYKFVLILLVGLAAISGARKDFNQFLALAHDVHAFADHWVVVMLPTGKAPTVAPAETCQEKVKAGVATTSEFRWRGRVEQGKNTEIKRLSPDIQRESDTRVKRITLTFPRHVSSQDAAETLEVSIPSDLPMNQINESRIIELHEWHWVPRVLIENSDGNIN